jgi:hypothetical protein
MSTRDSRLVFVVSKPFAAEDLAPHISNRWPGQTVHFVCTMYLGLFEFSYPRGLKFSDLPFISSPRWKRREVPRPVLELKGDRAQRTDLDAATVLSDADQIYFATDPDPAGANAFDIMLSQSIEAHGNVDRPVLVLDRFDADSIQRAFDHPISTASETFKNWLNQGECKRHFDFNFNVNSLVLFGSCLRAIGIDRNSTAISKYGLQLLFHLGQSKPLKEIDLHQVMRGWRGTGRYEPTSLGSNASRSQIISDLHEMQLIEDLGDRRLGVSALGRSLLARIHPDCEDADLPARVQLWARTWPASKPNVEKYLRTFFGKQQRFFKA